MKTSTAEILREYGPFPGLDRVDGVTYDGRQVWFAAGDKLNAFDPASGKMLRSHRCRRPRRNGLRRPAPLSDRRGPHPEDRSGDGPRARHHPGARRRRRFRARLGRRARSGWGSIGTGRSIRSIPRPGRYFAPSNAAASSPASPGSTANSGTAPGKTRRAICGASIRGPARCWRSSPCRPASPCPASNPMAPIGSSAAAAAAAR